LDNFNNPTYPDGFASSVYGVNAPLVNALHAPGDWNVYDIVFRRPVYKDGVVLDPGHVTVFVNGVLTQDHTQLEGPTGHKARSKPGPFPEVGPLKLQDHGNPVRYRNIWYRPLPARAIEGGTDGPLTAEATAAKRAQIAAEIREDASKKEGQAKLLRLLESLVYQADGETLKQSSDMAGEFVKSVQALPPDQQESKKEEVLHLQNALGYLSKWHLVAEEIPAKTEIDQIVKDHGWDKKKK
jgi:hypothetical protein